MIVYLDTSALVKLYINETASEKVKKQVDSASVVATSVVAYPETLSAFTRARREKRISQDKLRQLVKKFKEDWPGFFQLQIDEHLLLQAGDYVLNLNLRGFDSIHLAAAALLKDRKKPLLFLCFDQKMNTAAKKVLNINQVLFD